MNGGHISSSDSAAGRCGGRKRRKSSAALGCACQSSSDANNNYERHAASMLAVMQNLRQRNELCDVALSVQGRKIFAHRLVLASCSEYFNAMFTGSLRECRQEDVDILEVEYEVMESIVAFAYTAELNVTEENVQPLLKASSMFQLMPIQDACCEFLRSQLDPSNSLGIMRFAEMNGCAELKRQACSYSLQHFAKVVQHEEFLHLTVDEVSDLIERDSLNVKAEDEVYQAVLLWTNHDFESRLPDFPTFLEHVRLPLCSWEFLTRITQETPMNHKLVKKECLRFVNEAKRFHASKFHPQLQGELNIRTFPRHCYIRTKFIYAIGGESASGRTMVDTVERFSISTRLWSEVGQLPSPRRGVGTAVVDKVLYVVGGSDGHSALSSLDCLDLQTRRWKTGASMHRPRSSVAVIALRGFVYACGGYDGLSSMASAEFYHPNYNEWTLLPDMLNARSMLGIASIGKYLYVIGGYNGIVDLNTVERFDLTSQQWSHVASMNQARSLLSAVTLNGKIYVAGGCHHNTSLKSTEVYDPDSNTWCYVGEMECSRSGLGLAVVDGCIYAVGGYDGNQVLDTVEVYHPEADDDQWSPGQSLDTPRKRFGCCYS